MTNILAIDTSSRSTYVAVQSGPEALIEQIGTGENSHNEELAVLVKCALDSSNLSCSELNFIVLGSGPGSFTGLRIGYGFAKGVATAVGIPIISVDSFEAYALEFLEADRLYVVVLDARRAELFSAGYCLSADGAGELRLPLGIRTFAELTSEAAEVCRAHQLLGIEYICPDMQLELDQNLLRPAHVGRSMLKIGSSRLQAAKSEISELEPNYLRAVSAKTMAERGVVLGG